jgi:hypothetical protein
VEVQVEEQDNIINLPVLLLNPHNQVNQVITDLEIQEVQQILQEVGLQQVVAVVPAQLVVQFHNPLQVVQVQL